MSVGHATVTETEPIEDDQTRLTFLYGAVINADNDVTVDVLRDDEWGW